MELMTMVIIYKYFREKQAEVKKTPAKKQPGHKEKSE